MNASACRQTASQRASRPRPKRSRPIAFDSLEERKVLSTASAFSGAFSVSVSERFFSNGDVDLYATLKRNGSVVRDNIPVATTSRHEVSPSVNINSNGRFVVAYEDVFSSSDSDVRIRVYDDRGNALTSAMSAEITNKREFQPDVDINSSGRIVVAYTQQFSSNDLDVRATQFYPSSSAGTSYTKTTYVVAGQSGRNEFEPEIYLASNGDAAIAYTRRVSSTDLDVNVFVRRTTGTTRSVVVANSSSNEDQPDVVTFGGGSSVTVSYRKGGSRFSRTVSV